MPWQLLESLYLFTVVTLCCLLGYWLLLRNSPGRMESSRASSNVPMVNPLNMEVLIMEVSSWEISYEWDLSMYVHAFSIVFMYFLASHVS